MEMKNREGFELINSDDVTKVNKFIQALQKFKTTYFVFNRQLNNLLKIGDEITKKEIR